MHAFTRLASFLLFVLSLSFLTCALPAPAASNNNDLVVGYAGADGIVAALIDLVTNVKVCTDRMVAANTIIEVKAEVDTLVVHVNSCAGAILAIGAIEIDAEVKKDIAAKVAAIISIIVRACLSVSVKFGIAVVLGIFAQIDLCIKLLLVNLGVCIDGIIILVANIVATTCADILVNFKFTLCLGFLAIGNL